MPDDAAANPQTNTETYADFKTKFDDPASAADADVEVNPHGAKGSAKDTSAAADKGEPKPEGGSDPLQQQDKVEKRKQQIQRDIDGHVARREAAKREADAEVARLEKLRAGNPSPKDSAAAAQPSGAAAAKPFDGSDANDPEPKQADYTDYQEWMDARAGWIGRKEFRKLEYQKSAKATEDAQARAREENERGYKAAVADFEARGTAYAEEHDDYPELVEKLKGTKISPETEAFLLWACEGDEGPRTLHGLMKDPEKLKTIDDPKKTPIQRFNALYEFKYQSRIAELEAKLAAKETPPAEKKKSSAPPAGTNLKGSGAAAGVTVDNATNYGSFKKAFDKREGYTN